jgi:4-amino-4-deoxy-L-arabinose transferase-like glycosyltransferase
MDRGSRGTLPLAGPGQSPGLASLNWLLGLTLVRLAIAAFLPLSPDEAYYWVWSRALAPGYLDHPPMVALWIRVGTTLAGETSLGIRLLAPLSAALATILLAQAADRLFPAERPGLRAAILFNATLLVGGAAVTVTPDTPLLLFWIAAIWAVAHDRWVIAGIAGGLALDSKYTAGLLAPALIVWLGLTDSWRRRGPWIAAGIAATLFLPVIAWNAGHDWASFDKQGARLEEFDPEHAVRYLGELIGGQFGLMTPGIAILATAGTVFLWPDIRERAEGLVGLLILIPVVVFVQHAVGDRVQANWPLVIYPAASIAAALLPNPWRRFALPSAALGYVALAAVLAQALFAPFALPVTRDPTLLRLAGWPALAADAEAARLRLGAAWIAADNYGVASILALHSPGPVLGAEGRWKEFDLPDASGTTETGLLLRSTRRADPPDPAFWATAEPVGELTRARHGLTAETFRLYRVRARPDAPAIVLLPRP